MDTFTIIFVLLLFVASVVLIVEARPYLRKNYSHHNPDEEADRIARREALKEFHRLRRERDKNLFKVDKLHDEFVQRTSNETPMIEPPQSDSPPQMSNSQGDS